jgi:hypothetical protein
MHKQTVAGTDGGRSDFVPNPEHGDTIPSAQPFDEAQAHGAEAAETTKISTPRVSSEATTHWRASSGMSLIHWGVNPAIAA